MRNKSEKKYVLVIHNVRSAHNVGSMFRTADGAGVDEIILTGYSPTPPKKSALYLTDADKAFKKTALGAEEYVPWKKKISLQKVLAELKEEGFEIAVLEQDKKSHPLFGFRPKKRVALIVGNEVLGVDAKVLKQSDVILEIPMHGQKNSLNVSVAAGIALYQIIGTIKKKPK